jgi:hypothetical protein
MNDCDDGYSMPLRSDSGWSESLTIYDCSEDLRWFCDGLTGDCRQGPSRQYEEG